MARRMTAVEQSDRADRDGGHNRNAPSSAI
jgi:hypothetical protein